MTYVEFQYRLKEIVYAVDLKEENSIIKNVFKRNIEPWLTETEEQFHRYRHNMEEGLAVLFWCAKEYPFVKETNNVWAELYKVWRMYTLASKDYVLQTQNKPISIKSLLVVPNWID